MILTEVTIRLFRRQTPSTCQNSKKGLLTVYTVDTPDVEHYKVHSVIFSIYTNITS